ncbi:MAG: L,D-transpeptidase [Ktedonobacterales bacterium]
MEHTAEGDTTSVLSSSESGKRPCWIWRIAIVLGIGAILASIFPVSCALDARAAQSAQQRLDHELQVVRTSLNVPDTMLQPIVTREHTLATAATNSNSAKAYQDASTGYTQLYNQVLAIEHMTPQQVRALTQKDMQQLTTSLQQVEKQDFTEAARFRKNLQQAQQQLNTATTPKELFTLDGFVLAQTAAVQQIEPVYHQYQLLKAQVDAQDKALGVAPSTPQPLECARGATEAYFWTNPNVSVTPAQSGATYEYQQWPAQDLALFRAAASAQDYAALSTLMNAQTQQLYANVAQITPAQTVRLVNAFQADVQTYQQDGGKDTQFQQQAAQDSQSLDAAKTLADYTKVMQTVEKHRAAMALPLLKVQTQHDLQTLQQLVNKAQSFKTIDPANGIGYPDGYEYASQATGIGDARDRLAAAQTQDDYQAVDDEIQMLSTNLQAMLQNRNDSTPSDKPHQTDLSLLQHYNLTGARVMVVSLREQTARMYDNGKFVKAIKVTTGNPDLPSPPGVHCVLEKMENYDDISPFPKGSPYYYNPTHINYGMVYSDYGYIVHDAWWRSWFGKYSNLPHYDPISFNNGSHGCVNLPLGDMAWLYNWADIGTPVLVY